MSSFISTWRTWASTVRSLRTRRLAMPVLVSPSAISSSTSRSRSDSSSSGPSPPAGRRRPRHDLRVERRAAAGDPFGGVEELADVEHAVLEQVAEAAERHELDGVAVSMCWESTSTPTSGWASLDRTRGARALVGEGGRHADVDDDEVGAMSGDRRHQVLGVAHRGERPRGPPSANRRASPSRRSTWSSAITTRMAAPRSGSCPSPGSLSTCSAAALRRDAVGEAASGPTRSRATRRRRRRR